MQREGDILLITTSRGTTRAAIDQLATLEVSTRYRMPPQVSESTATNYAWPIAFGVIGSIFLIGLVAAQ